MLASSKKNLIIVIIIFDACNSNRSGEIFIAESHESRQFENEYDKSFKREKK